MNIAEIYKLFVKHPIICTDSRLAQPNSIFFALKGENFNGNKYAHKALDKCEYAIIDEEAFCMNDRYILVSNALEALQNLAFYHRKRLGTPILAITGTNGKTTTKELIAKVLSKKYNVAYTKGNLNNHIGVPLTLLQLNQDHDYGVIEMGANHIGEIALLCKIAAPDFGIITNVGKAHLEGFGSYDGIKKAKGELYRYLYENFGVAFINDDSEVLEDMNPPHDSILYGSRGFTHCQGKIIESDLFLKIAWYATSELTEDDDELDWESKSRIITTHLIGAYNFENVLAAICVGDKFGVSHQDIKEAIESYIPSNNRSQLEKTSRNTLLLDGYNANPTSMKKSVENFASLKFENKMVILGDMLELGNAAVREHGVVVGMVEELKFEQAFLVGEIFSTYSDVDGVKTFKDVDELSAYLKINLLSSKSILVKGSRGIGLEKVLEYL